MSHPAGAAMAEDEVAVAEMLPPAATLLAGVPALTILAMIAIRYIASGTL